MSDNPLAKFREAVMAAAFQSVPGEQYNYARRELLERDGTGALVYELMLPEREDWATWRDRTLPLMLKYFRSQGIDPEYPTAAVVAVFYGSRCFFVEGTKFIELLRELEGLNASAWRFRVLRWLSA
ncbi:MAG: STAUR_1299 family protein [Verrucomicrobiae bacterium]|nr:STAUR_1299 family protein [Verrucomicrobiae bacterium]MDW8344501.1 STAUR_1299 family protein [Verrucomicrobiae bacterium]